MSFRPGLEPLRPGGVWPRRDAAPPRLDGVPPGGDGMPLRVGGAMGHEGQGQVLKANEQAGWRVRGRWGTGRDRMAGAETRCRIIRVLALMRKELP